MIDPSFLLDICKHLATHLGADDLTDTFSFLKTEQDKDAIKKIKERFQAKSDRFVEIMGNIERLIKSGKEVDEKEWSRGISVYIEELQLALQLLMGKGVPMSLIYALASQGSIALSTDPMSVWRLLITEEERQQELADKKKKREEDERVYAKNLANMLKRMRSFYDLHDEIQEDYKDFYNYKAEIERLTTVHKINKHKIKRLKGEIVGLQNFLAEHHDIDPSTAESEIKNIDKNIKLLDVKKLEHLKKRDTFLQVAAQLETDKGVLQSKLVPAQQKLNAIEGELQVERTLVALQRRQAAAEVHSAILFDLAQLERDIQDTTSSADAVQHEIDEVLQSRSALIDRKELIESVVDATKLLAEKNSELVAIEVEQQSISDQLDELKKQAALQEKLIAGKKEKRNAELNAAKELEGSEEHEQQAKLALLMEEYTHSLEEVKRLQASGAALAAEIESKGKDIAERKADIARRKANGESAYQLKLDGNTLALLEEELAGLQAERAEVSQDLQLKLAASEASKKGVAQYEQKIRGNSPTTTQASQLAHVFTQLSPPPPIPLPPDAGIIPPHQPEPARNRGTTPGVRTPQIDPDNRDADLPTYEQSEAAEAARRSRLH